MADLEQRPSGLWVAHSFSVLRHHATKRTVTLPDGRRALVTTDDSGTVRHIESSQPGSGVSDRLDAIVRPRTIRIRIPLTHPGG